MGILKKKLPAFRLEKRDILILTSLFESRIMTAAHIAVIHFEGRGQAAKKRLQKLKKAGLIAAKERRVNAPEVLFLTPAALNLLKTEGVLSGYPQLGLPTLKKRAQVSEVTIRHELNVMDVKAAFHRATQATKYLTVLESTTWPLLNEFTAYRSRSSPEKFLVRPDGFFRIGEKDGRGEEYEYSFYLEVDRSNETQEKLVNRAGCYRDYYQSGGFAQKCGGDPAAYEQYPFRVLIVLKSAERRNNTAEHLLANVPPIRTQVYLTTQAEVTADPLGPIWVRPLDYQKTLAGTAFESKSHSGLGYKTPTERERWVDQNLVKVRLLD